MIGKTISHYKIIEKLGQGGMGEIYKAEDIKLKRTVALKFLPASFSYDKDAKIRLMHEAQSVSALDHHNICTIYEFGETKDGQLFISMALYEGETLKEKIKKGPIKTDEALNITLQISEGLKKAHQNNIIHRDIKPANIFITSEGIVKILDFGLAKAVGQTQLTKYGTTLGTIDYMSPEQSRGDKVDKRSDIWSLGVVLYEMLTGQVPFKGDYEQAVIYSILNITPDYNKIPKALIPILKKTITKSPKERYQNIEDLNADLLLLNNKTGSGGYKLIARSGIRKISFRLTLVSTLIFLMVLYTIYHFNFRKNPNELDTNEVVRRMIVVLPFDNLGPADDDYFVQGMREEISNKLASLGNIGVISRSSAEKFANSNKTSREIGEELGVTYILEGTVQWAKSKDQASRIRIIPQLIRVSDDINIWSESYDRVINDVFSIQNEIAQNVVDKIGIKLLPGQTVTGPPPTKNLEAYDYYLKALKFHYGPSTGANIKTCVKLYEQAVTLDSNFAAAHAQLSIAYNGLFKWYWDRDSLNLKKAVWHLKKAEELNPSIAEIHLAKYFYYVWFTDDNERVFQELKKTLEIQPNNADAMHNISWHYWKKGEFDLAKQCEIKSMRLDPLNARYPQEFGITYSERRDYITAEKYLKKAIELSPTTSGYYVDLADIYLDWKGDTKLAWQTVENIKDGEYLEFHPNIYTYLNVLDRNYNDALNQIKSSKKEFEDNGRRFIPNFQMTALIYRYMGKEELSKKYFDSAKVRIEKMTIQLPDDYRLSLSVGVCYAGLDKKEMALTEINNGIQQFIHGWGMDEKNYLHKKYLAQVYTLLGDYKNALSQIEFLLSNPTGFSINRLKLDPLYDPLRNLPTYEEIIKKYSNEN